MALGAHSVAARGVAARAWGSGAACPPRAPSCTRGCPPCSRRRRRSPRRPRSRSGRGYARSRSPVRALRHGLGRGSVGLEGFYRPKSKQLSV